MQNVLVVIPAGKEPQSALRAAIDLAKARAVQLVALVVLDPSVSSGVTSTLTEVGFMSDEVGSQVSNALLHEYRVESEVVLQGLAERAKREGVAVTPLIEQGDTGDICSRVIRAHQIGTAIVVAEKRSWWTRFLSRNAAVSIPALSGCEVRLMEED